jgi:hypothetical protein
VTRRGFFTAIAAAAAAGVAIPRERPIEIVRIPDPFPVLLLPPGSLNFHESWIAYRKFCREHPLPRLGTFEWYIEPAAPPLMFHEHAFTLSSPRVADPETGILRKLREINREFEADFTK